MSPSPAHAVPPCAQGTICFARFKELDLFIGIGVGYFIYDTMWMFPFYFSWDMCFHHLLALFFLPAAFVRRMGRGSPQTLQCNPAAVAVAVARLTRLFPAADLQPVLVHLRVLATYGGFDALCEHALDPAHARLVGCIQNAGQEVGGGGAVMRGKMLSVRGGVHAVSPPAPVPATPLALQPPPLPPPPRQA